MLRLAVSMRRFDVIHPGSKCRLGDAGALVDHILRHLIARLAPTVLVAHATQGDDAEVLFGLTETAILHRRSLITDGGHGDSSPAS